MPTCDLEIVQTKPLSQTNEYYNINASASDVPGSLTCILQPAKFNVQVEKAYADYSWKAGLKKEGTLRLDMWEAAHRGEEYTLGVVQEYKRLVDNAVRREIAFRHSGEVYRAALLAPNCISKTRIESEIARIDQNVAISTSDQYIEITHYQTVEFEYLQQEQRRRTKVLLEEQARDLEELLQKQAIDRQIWEQRVRMATGMGLGAIGLTILAISVYYIGKMKGKEV